VCAIERPPHTTGVFKFLAHKGNINGLKSVRVLNLHDNLFTNPSIAKALPTVTSICPCPVKDNLLSIITPKSLIASTRSRMIPPNIYENSIR
jgi:hypothetical protein